MYQNRPVYACGYDFGNADAMVVIKRQGIVKRRSIPSISIVADSNRSRELQSTFGDAGSIERSLGEETLLFKQHDIEKYLGRKAMKQHGFTTTRGNIARYWGSDSIEFLLALSASVIPERDYDLKVVTQLPVDTYTTPNKELVITKIGNNGLPFDFLLNGKQRSATIEILRVAPEGAGTIIKVGKQPRTTKAVIDIGGRTTNLFVIDSEGDIDQKRTHHLLYGVEAIGDLLNEWLLRDYKTQLSPLEMRQCLRAFAHRDFDNFPDIGAGGKVISSFLIQSKCEQFTKEVEKQIINGIRIAWNASETNSIPGYNIREIFFVGGGTYHFWDGINAMLENRLIAIEEPEWKNVEGLAIMADRILEKQQQQQRSQSYSA